MIVRDDNEDFRAAMSKNRIQPPRQEDAAHFIQALLSQVEKKETDTPLKNSSGVRFTVSRPSREDGNHDMKNQGKAVCKLHGSSEIDKVKVAHNFPLSGYK